MQQELSISDIFILLFIAFVFVVGAITLYKFITKKIFK
jgi:hypothetical protein